MEQIQEKLFALFQKIPRSFYLPILLSMAGVIFFGIGLIQLLSANKSTSVPLAKTTPTIPTISTPPNLFGAMQVDVEGAVVNPGVYKLANTARVQDALIAAGGLSSTADREVVAKSLNLAAKLTDGAKIYIPKIGDASVIPAQAGIQDASGAVLGAQTSLIDINSATADQLDSLPGIGPVTAQKIISARPFSTIDDLLARKVVSNSVYQKIKDQITAN